MDAQTLQKILHARPATLECMRRVTASLLGFRLCDETTQKIRKWKDGETPLDANDLRLALEEVNRRMVYARAVYIRENDSAWEDLRRAVQECTEVLLQVSALLPEEKRSSVCKIIMDGHDAAITAP